MEKQASLLNDYLNGKAKKHNDRFAQQRQTDTPDTSTLWAEDIFQQLNYAVDRQLQTLAILRKHLPHIYQVHVRLLWSDTVWKLIVKRPAMANELNWIADKLASEIAHDTGFKPNLEIICKPANWETGGQRIRHPEVVTTPLPSAEEADIFINSLIKS